MTGDRVVSMFYLNPNDHMTVEFHVITSATRSAALLMTARCMRNLVDSYSIFCAKQAMLFKHAVKLYWQRALDAQRRFHQKHMGVAWPLMQQIHPVSTMTADDAYLMTAMEFVTI